MPLYFYHCLECEENFEIFHSMREKIEQCEKCKCNHIVRIPQMPLSIENRKDDKKVGDLTKQYIEDAKEDLRQQKEEMLKEKEKTI